jgi:hypothetical protein
LCKSNKRGAIGIGWAWGSKRKKQLFQDYGEMGRTNVWSADGTYLAFFDEEEISTQETTPMDGMNRRRAEMIVLSRKNSSED